MNYSTLFTAIILLNLLAMSRATPIYNELQKEEDTLLEFIPHGFEDLMLRLPGDAKRNFPGNIFHGVRGKRPYKPTISSLEEVEVLKTINKLNRELTLAILEARQQRRGYNSDQHLSGDEFH